MKNVDYVVDCGTNKSTVYVKALDKTLEMTHSQLLDYLVGLPSGSLVVSEAAHLAVPRKKLSRSQPFTEAQLLDLYDKLYMNGIDLKLFPQRSTPNACSYSGLPKSDHNDPKSICIYIEAHPNVSLMNPPLSFNISEKRKASFVYKSTTNDYINIARREDVPYSEDGCSKWIRKNINRIAESLSQESREIFKLNDDSKFKSNSKSGVKGEFNFSKVKMNALFAVVCTMIDFDGNVRVRPETGRMPGLDYIERFVLCLSPFHQRGGVARSNLFWHTFRPYLIAEGKKYGFNFNRKVGDSEDVRTIRRGDFTPEEEVFFLRNRKKFTYALKELLKVIRDLIKSDSTLEIQDSRCHSEESEFTPLSRFSLI